MIGLAFEHQLRTLTAKPEVAAILLMVNGLLLFAAERFRRRAEVRELAIREGAKPDGGRELDTLEYREALVGRLRPVDGAASPASAATASRWARAWRAASTTATPPASRSCSPPRSSSRPASSSSRDLLGHVGNGIRGQALVAGACAAVTAVFTVALPACAGSRPRTLMPFAIYCLLFG